MVKQLDQSRNIPSLMTTLSLVLVFIQVIMAMPSASSQSELKNVAASTNRFALDLQKVLSKHNTGNLFCSPLSLQVALAMASVGAGDNTKSYNEIKSLLKFPEDKSNMLSSYNLLSDALTKSDVLKMANRIFIDQKFKVKPEYLETTKKYFKSDAKEVDFEKNSVVARKEINNWVEQQTNNKIKNLIAGDLDPATVMILINAIHFKADWKNSFDKELTRKENFYLDETRTVEVDMMHLKSDFNFFHDENLKAKFLEMPYKGDEFSMIVILPDSKTGLGELEAAITSESFDLPKKIERLQRSGPPKVVVSMPKFEMEQTHELVNTLKELGVEEIFSDKANFSKIDPNNGIKVSKIIQKAFVSVDEKGTEAAAATAIGFAPRSLFIPKSEEFNADHPFMFLIAKRLQNSDASIGLFSGIYRG